MCSSSCCDGTGRQGSQGGSGWPRVVLEPEDVLLLESVFALKPTPNRRLCKTLSRRLGVRTHQIQQWFQDKQQRTDAQSSCCAGLAVKAEIPPTEAQDQLHVPAARGTCEQDQHTAAQQSASRRGSPSDVRPILEAEIVSVQQLWW